MKQREKEDIYKYWYLKDLRLADDVATYEDRYKVRKCDEADHLESIIAITRQKMFDEVMLDIFRILELGPYDKRILKNKGNRVLDEPLKLCYYSFIEINNCTK